MDDNEECPICIFSYNQSICWTNINVLKVFTIKFFEHYYQDIQSVDKVLLTCCKKHICSNCLYSHIKSILEEGITLQGRTTMTCPFPDCNKELDDNFVLTSFVKGRNDTHTNALTGSVNATRLLKLWQNFRFLFYYSSILLRLFPVLVALKLKPFLSPLLIKDFDHIILRKHQLTFLLKNDQERRDIDLYHRWSLTVALNRDVINSQRKEEDNNISQNKNAINPHHVYTHVTRCPTPDCTCLWLTNKLYYNEKMKKENKYTNDSNSTTMSQIKKSLLTRYCFKPVHPHREEEIMNENGYTTEHWLNPIDIGLFDNNNNNSKNNRQILNRLGSATTNYNLYSTIKPNRFQHFRNYNYDDQNDNDDGRMQTCASCRQSFCNLCLQPWHSIHTETRAYLTHSNLTCQKFHRKSISATELQEYKSINRVIDARTCPGCGMRTNRSSGCNHITCPCSYEWCYVCECKWSRTHYGCSDTNPLILRKQGTCIVS